MSSSCNEWQWRYRGGMRLRYSSLCELFLCVFVSLFVCIWNNYINLYKIIYILFVELYNYIIIINFIYSLYIYFLIYKFYKFYHIYYILRGFCIVLFI